MTHPSRRPTLAPALLACTLLGACLADGVPQGVPLTPEEIEYQRRLEAEAAPAVTPRERSDLLVRLDQNLQLWHRARLGIRAAEDRRMVHNLEEVLQLAVYKDFDAVLDFLVHGDAYQRPIAAAALGFARLREPEDPQTRERFLERWPRLYPRAVPALIVAVESDDPLLVQNALLALYMIGDGNTPLAPVLARLDSSNPKLRSHATLALSTILTRETAEPAVLGLMGALNDANGEVRNHAVSAAANLRHPSFAGRLAQLLDDPSLLIQANAARALGELGDWRNAEFLIDRLTRLEREMPKERVRTELTNLDQSRNNLRHFLIAALEKLSGLDHGDDLKQWNAWWEARRASR